MAADPIDDRFADDHETAALARLNGAWQALARIHTVFDARWLVDHAEGIKQLAKRVGANLAVQNEAAEVKLRAMRRGGQLLIESGITPGRPEKSSANGTISDLGLTKNDSSHWQAMAGLPERVFDGYIATTLAAPDKELTTAGALRLVAELKRGQTVKVVTPRPVSVVESDQEALGTLLELHAGPEARILDVTYGRGVIWRGLPFSPHRADKNPQLKELGFVDTVCDFRELPFGSASYDVLVFDPPHLADVGDDSQLDGIDGRYGLDDEDLRGDDNVSHLFQPFLAEARRVLEPRHGRVICKIADLIHNEHYQLQHRDLIETAEALGYELDDLVIRVAYQRANLNDPRWETVRHVRQVHSYWLELRRP
jgi:hypothetical protein